MTEKVMSACYFPARSINERHGYAMPITLMDTGMQNIKGFDNFRQMIIDFVDYAEKSEKNVHSMTNICHMFNFQKRRLYDVLNVLDVVGAAQKTSVDTFEWLYFQNVGLKIAGIKKDAFKNLKDNVIENAFPNDQCFSMSKLTFLFLNILITSPKRSINLKSEVVKFTKNRKKIKSILCKLYQISHILESAGILSKASNPSEITFAPRFFPYAFEVAAQFSLSNIVIGGSNTIVDNVKTNMSPVLPIVKHHCCNKQITCEN